MIEFGNRANGAPARSGVAVLARNRQRSVRTTSAALLTSRERSAPGRGGEKQQPTQDLNQLRRNILLSLSFPEIVSGEMVVECHNDSNSSHDIVPCAQPSTTVPVFSFWPGQQASPTIVPGLLVPSRPCPAQMSQILNVAGAEISASFDTPCGDLVPFRAKSRHGRAAREGGWLKGLVRAPLPPARGTAYGRRLDFKGPMFGPWQSVHFEGACL